MPKVASSSLSEVVIPHLKELKAPKKFPFPQAEVWARADDRAKTQGRPRARVDDNAYDHEVLAQTGNGAQPYELGEELGVLQGPDDHLREE